MIVQAVGTAVGVNSHRAAELDRVMSDAVAKAQSKGITDPHEIRERILAARDEFLRGS